MGGAEDRSAARILDISNDLCFVAAPKGPATLRQPGDRPGTTAPCITSTDMEPHVQQAAQAHNRMVMHSKSAHPLLSVVIPVYNEQESLIPLLDRLLPVLEGIGEHEIIFINDGSSDNSRQILTDFAIRHPQVVKVLSLRINKGKSIALQHGFQKATGQFVLMMDADLQDRPEEIPSMLQYLKDNDLDVVNGWKFERRDPISKTLPSRLFNKVLYRFTGLKIHDFNCGLKLMKRTCLDGITLYGQLHRFLLVLIANKGHSIGEMPVEHAPRLHGKSKYGSKRLYEGLFDFFTIIFLTRYLRSPLYMFGYYGMTCFLLSFLLGSYYFFFKPVFGLLLDMHPGPLSNTPLWLLSPFLLITGLIFFCFGLLGELTYYLHAANHVASDLEVCEDECDITDAIPPRDPLHE